MGVPPGSRPPPLRIVRRDPAWCRVTGKARYGTRVEALMTLREVQAKRSHGQVNRAESRVYECGFCDGGFHLTSQEYREEGEIHGQHD